MAGPPPRRDDQTDILHTRPSVRAIVRHHFIDPEEDGGRGERLLKQTRNTDYGADAAADTAAVAVVSSCKIMSTGAASGEEAGASHRAVFNTGNSRAN